MKVFIIEDEEVSLFLTQQVLINSKVTNEIHSFLSAEEAFRSIQAGSDEDVPDVILLDLNLPVMDGWGFLDALMPHWEGLKKKCRIYILTSSLDSFDEEKAKTHSMVSGLLSKPINRESVRIIDSPK